jgi:hypothetical protein
MPGDSPHHVTFYRVSVLVIAHNRHAVPCFAEVTEHVGADLEFGRVYGRVSVGGTFDQAELGAICGVRRVYVKWEGD